jgi:hypothetical protein
MQSNGQVESRPTEDLLAGILLEQNNSDWRIDNQVAH